MLWTSHGEQLVQKQETDFSIVTYDESDHREPAPNTDVVLSYNSPDRGKEYPIGISRTEKRTHTSKKD